MSVTAILCYTDGASRGNPGLAGAGGVCYKSEQELFTVSAFLGEQTNNYAEYEAIYLVLEELIQRGLTTAPIEIHMDSKLAAEQLSGNWKVKNENVRGQFKKVQALLPHFKEVTFKHVYREHNARADELANEGIDGR